VRKRLGLVSGSANNKHWCCYEATGLGIDGEANLECFQGGRGQKKNDAMKLDS
jgi:hypothetical protein